MWTDHKNLACIQSVKQLYSSQASWFDFHLTYRPRSRKVKLDALSRLHSSEDVTDSLETIVPPGRVVGPLKES